MSCGLTDIVATHAALCASMERTTQVLEGYSTTDAAAHLALCSLAEFVANNISSDIATAVAFNDAAVECAATSCAVALSPLTDDPLIAKLKGGQGLAVDAGTEAQLQNDLECAISDAKAKLAETEEALRSTDLMTSETSQWKDLTRERDQHRQKYVHLLSVLAAGLRAKRDALESAVMEPPPSLVNNGSTLTAALAARASSIVAAAAETRRDALSTCTASLAEVAPALDAAWEVMQRRVYAESKLGELAKSHEEVKSESAKVRDAAQALADLRRRMGLDDDDDDDDDDDGGGDEDADPEMAEANERHRRRLAQLAKCMRERDARVDELVMLGTPPLQHDAWDSFDADTGMDLPDIAIRAARVVRPFKPLIESWPEQKKARYHMQQLLQRDGLLVEGRKKSDYNDDIPSIMYEATSGKVAVSGKRLPNGVCGEGELKILKEFPMSDYKLVKRSIIAANRLRHPGVVPVECAFLEKDTVVVQSRFYEGGNMRQWMRSGHGRSARLAAAQKIAVAVAYLHDHGVIHRDIKPENIVFDGRGAAAAPALCDFDLAVDSSHTITRTSSKGTLIYMCPEPEISDKTDIFALGVTLYECFFCDCDLDRIPVRDSRMGRALDRAAVVSQLAAAAPHDPLARIAQTMMNDEAADRPNSAEVARLLGEVVANEVTAQQAELDSKAEAVAKLTTAAQAKQAELANEQAEIAELRKASKRESTEVQKRAAAAAKAEADLKAEMQTVASDAAAVEAMRQRVESDRKKLRAQQKPVPGYWKHKDLNKTHFKLEQSRFMEPKLQALMRSTFMHASGCASGQSLSSVTVTRVHRIENTVLWKNYTHRKAVMLELSKGNRPAAVTASGHETIDADANELFLFHGTAPATACVIAKNGFDERVGALTGLYGGGCYFAENSCKSNQYARGTTPTGERTMLYCRVLMGDAYRTSSQLTNARRPPAKPGSDGAAFDSVLASGGTQVHREFIVYDRNQVYPEFIIYYKA